MKELKTLYEELIRNPKKWDYYGCISVRECEFHKLLKDSQSFITSYLSRGEKTNSRTNEQIDFLARDGDRLEHTISIFFFGILLYENVEIIRCNMDKFLNKNEQFINDDLEETPFSYYWFLICFFHDLGYYFESKDTGFLFNKLVEYQDEGVSLKIPLFYRGIPKVIVNNWNRYFRYRLNEMNCVDHGIVGGVLFYNERRNDYLVRKSIHKRMTFVHGGLRWSNSILRHIHLPVAWTIIAHNVWFVEEKSQYAPVYRRYGLSGLVRNQPIINIRDHPLLCILSIVDSIDPVKSFLCIKRDFSMTEILNMLKLEFHSSGFNITLNSDNEELLQSYFDTARKLSCWIQCDTSVVDRVLFFEIK